MTQNFVVGLGQQVILLVMELAGPMLIAGLVVGLIISVFQATTQIQEQTLSFLPKIAAMVVVLLLTGPWMLQQIMDFTGHVLGNLQSFGG